MVEAPLPVPEVPGEARKAFHARCIRTGQQTGQQVPQAMMEADRETDRVTPCGPKDRHCWRGANTASRVTFGSRQMKLPRLRARSTEGKVASVSFRPFGLSVLRWAARRISPG